MRIDSYDITANDHQFVLTEVKVSTNKESKNFGKEMLVNPSYHSSWSGVVRKLAKLELMDAVSELDGVESATERFVNDMMRFESEITKVLGR